MWKRYCRHHSLSKANQAGEMMKFKQVYPRTYRLLQALEILVVVYLVNRYLL